MGHLLGAKNGIFLIRGAEADEATYRVVMYASRGLLVLPTDEESYANPPSIWRSVPPSGRE